MPRVKNAGSEYYALEDVQHGMVLHVPFDPQGRARLTVNPEEVFDKRSFRSRRVDKATLTMACPRGSWVREFCKPGMVVQAVHYREGLRDKVLRDFMSGRLQARHKKDQERLAEILQRRQC